MSDPGRARWTEEDLALLRVLGGRMSQLIHGEDIDVPDQQRRDELGILANMVSRLARELRAKRRQQREQRDELNRRVEELQSAYDTQEKLFSTIRGLPSPILELHEGVLLVPLVGEIDADRVGYLQDVLPGRAVATSAQSVILDVSTAPSMTPERAASLLRIEQPLRHTGARAILAGVAPPLPRELSPFVPCETLHEALVVALDRVGYHIKR